MTSTVRSMAHQLVGLLNQSTLEDNQTIDGFIDSLCALQASDHAQSHKEQQMLAELSQYFDDPIAQLEA